MASSAPTAPPSTDVLAPCIQHNVDGVNRYRAEAGLAPLTMDDALSRAAVVGTQQFAAGGPAHGHMHDANAEIRAQTGANKLFENQGKRAMGPKGDAAAACTTLVDSILANMMAEGPGGGHHDAIVNPELRRIGVGLVVDGNRLYLTNDFAD